MILAVRLPFSTIPIIHAWWPSPYLGDFISAQNRAACSRGRQINRPPGKEREEVTLLCVAQGQRVAFCASSHVYTARLLYFGSELSHFTVGKLLL